MLHVSTVKPATLAILKHLMSIPELSAFALVGGTALSLRYGHRKSVDLDLFSSAPFDSEALLQALTRHIPSLRHIITNSIGVFVYVDDVKVDLVSYHHHPLIGEVEHCEGIRIVSDKDLVAMKVNAVLRRAVKKDFWDIAELLQRYSIDDFISFYTQKYPTQILCITVPRAITYFDEAEESDDPVSLKGQTWDEVKEYIKKKVRDYLT